MSRWIAIPDHGHDGVIRHGYVHNDDSIAVLTTQALHQAAGREST